ncbi:hypothetical protein AB0O07_34215 [Streptomyces sp. NPDC093085]|uniref:hypothetical protein n=1 Tax=Streptomyces sp. NPDC093085 TaxID=3155068 RepID=UPI003427B873
MAFGADELSLLRRALAAALHPAPLPRDDVQDCLRLAESVDEAMREAGRMRAFLVADLARYRAALPGSVAGYLDVLRDALAAGHLPGADDLAALRALRGNPAAAALLGHCGRLAEEAVRERLAAPRAEHRTDTRPGVSRAVPAPQVPPPPRVRLLALPGGRAADEPRKPARPAEPARPREPRKPAEPGKPAPKPAPRPAPKPSEVFPPRRKPAPPPERLAVG